MVPETVFIPRPKCSLTRLKSKKEADKIEYKQMIFILLWRQTCYRRNSRRRRIETPCEIEYEGIKYPVTDAIPEEGLKPSCDHRCGKLDVRYYRRCSSVFERLGRRDGEIQTGLVNLEDFAEDGDEHVAVEWGINQRGRLNFGMGRIPDCAICFACAEFFKILNLPD